MRTLRFAFIALICVSLTAALGCTPGAELDDQEVDVEQIEAELDEATEGEVSEEISEEGEWMGPGKKRGPGKGKGKDKGKVKIPMAGDDVLIVPPSPHPKRASGGSIKYIKVTLDLVDSQEGSESARRSFIRFCPNITLLSGVVEEEPEEETGSQSDIIVLSGRKQTKDACAQYPIPGSTTKDNWKNEYVFECKLEDGGPCDFGHLPFFRIGTDDNTRGPLFIESVRVDHVKFDGEAPKKKADWLERANYVKTLYYNPCLKTVFYSEGNRGSWKDFSPNDIAICAIVRTGKSASASSQADVGLNFKNTLFERVPFSYLDFNADNLAKNTVRAYGKTDTNYIGKFGPPEEKELKAAIVMKRDELGHDDWELKGIRIYIFNPGESLSALRPGDRQGSVTLFWEFKDMDIDKVLSRSKGLRYPSDKDEWLRFKEVNQVPKKFFQDCQLH